MERKVWKLGVYTYTTYLAWENAAASMFGGVYSSWPAWAQRIVREHYGYLPK